MRPSSTIDLLSAAYPDLSEDALLVLDEIADRMRVGQKTYGALDLDADDRDFEQEAYEEDLDGLVYRACKVVQERKGRL